MESSKLMSCAVPLPDAWRNCRFLIFLFPFGYFDVECTDVQEPSSSGIRPAPQHLFSFLSSPLLILPLTSSSLLFFSSFAFCILRVNSTFATSIPLDPDHPFHLYFSLDALSRLDCFGTPADCHTTRTNGEIIIKDPRHCTVVLGFGKHQSRVPSILQSILIP
ncbi:hypothetical protein DTO013E5_6787 [Penicillium roqueforti]|uniref:uncharacterized protein n=1 Tax=Penicillium roqueforti TaxID=5082 RepID=UPI00190AB7CD|nr:uncharacterized protein LCP9604111_8259 [Penicillium roqueforti]KAF9241986.1 hypothetical protein LCP9604111_8259 [Penicillium roqueforti]KAI1829615.1 hypothetical protein CBS147337_9622 [Penicillium roqueforti]KAI2679856.1 hypothetical protein CBS147355_4338 [Penicillium roqueforti]KAI2684229.1 hypothetical protein LCP963914a_5529 [Penicillium roqueforti]KAI2697404.1 hypothetical protein CBS147372_7764 [Penicillium roqueforti]